MSSVNPGYSSNEELVPLLRGGCKVQSQMDVPFQNCMWRVSIVKFIEDLSQNTKWLSNFDSANGQQTRIPLKPPIPTPESVNHVP
jgi:hypothetical protein